MLRFEFLCDSYRCYKGHVSKLTEKSSGIDSNKSATVKSEQCDIFHVSIGVSNLELAKVLQDSLDLNQSTGLTLVSCCFKMVPRSSNYFQQIKRT